jgi:hypothetical protein
MNLGKLLGAGRSFFGGSVVVSYREDKRVYLPKFNSLKNPFEPKSAGEATTVALPNPATAVRPVAAPQVSPAKLPVFTAPKPARAGNWADRFNPFRGPEPVAPELVKPVQTELSLQAVKVLHNDLSDADVEVVPVKSRTMAAVPAPQLLATRQPLEFFAENRLETV